MKKVIGIAILTLSLLVGCQSQSTQSPQSTTATSDSQGLVQMKQAIESEDLNTTLQDLHNQGMKIIDIKLWSTKKPKSAGQLGGVERIVYDIMYEEPSK